MKDSNWYDKLVLKTLFFFWMGVLAESRINSEYSYPSYRELRQNPGQLRTPEIIKKAGYPSETHYVMTKDKWQIQLNRIPGSPKLNNTKPTKAVMLPTCFFCTSSTYVITGPGKAIGFLLADDGYDVWLVSARGTTYSHNCTHDPYTFPYWDFSMNEIGTYDLPAVVDYIIETTGFPKIDIVGLSMGSASPFIMLAKKPEYNDKIRAMVGMAPAIYVTHANAASISLSIVRQFVIDMLMQYRWWFLPQRSWNVNNLLASTCSNRNFISRTMCDLMLYHSIGSRIEGIEPNNVAPIMMTFPDLASWRTTDHFAQVHSAGEFQEYDYGFIRNLINYRSRTPPKYDLNNIKIPFGILYADADMLVPPKDVERLAREVKNAKIIGHITDPSFSHMHFSWGARAAEYAHYPAIEFLNSIPPAVPKKPTAANIITNPEPITDAVEPKLTNIQLNVLDNALSVS